MAASVASHIPLALSLLHTVATQYPGLTKSQPTTNVNTAPSVPSVPAPAATLPVALPGSGSGAGNGSGTGTAGQTNGQASGTTGTTSGAGTRVGTPLTTPPASSNNSSTCEVNHFFARFRPRLLIMEHQLPRITLALSFEAEI